MCPRSESHLTYMIPIVLTTEFALGSSGAMTSADWIDSSRSLHVSRRSGGYLPESVQWERPEPVSEGKGLLPRVEHVSGHQSRA